MERARPTSGENPDLKPSSVRPGWNTGLKAFVSLALLLWLLHKVNFAEFASNFARASWISLSLVWGVQTALVFVQTERWRIIADRLSIKISFWPACQNVYIGQFFNQVLPSSFGGDAMRVWRLSRCSVPVNPALASVMLERIVALATVPIFALLGLGVLPHLMPARSLGLWLAILIGGLVIGLVLLLWLDRIPLPVMLAKFQVVDFLRRIPVVARRVFLSWGCISRAVLLSMVIHTGVGTSFWILALSLGVAAPLVEFVVLAPIIMLITAVPISLGGWGVREGATVTALALIGIPDSTSLAISIAFGLVMILVGLPGGLIWLRDADRRFALRATK